MPERYHEHLNQENHAPETLAQCLGLFSLALGTAELAAPGAVARLTGLPDDEDTHAILRAWGMREIVSGIGILSAPDDPLWLWSRVSGDALDLATLGARLSDERADPDRLVGSMAAVAGCLAVDAWCASRLHASREEEEFESLTTTPREAKTLRAARTLTINRQPDVVYNFWRKLENAPRFMRDITSVEELDERRSRWKARSPVGVPVSWESEIVQDRPHELIEWRSVPGSRIENRGSVRFRPAPGARGTEVRVELEYRVPGGRLGSLVAKVSGRAPDQQLQENLRRLKALLEAGEIARSGGSERARQPAQPLPGLRSPELVEGVRR